MPNARTVVCGAKRKRGREGVCQQYPLKGATRCRFHGGRNQQLPPGHPDRGGRPPTTGLYSRHFINRDPELIKAFLEAKAKIGDGPLADELAAARVLADWAIGKWAENPTGGVPTAVSRRKDGEQRIQIKPWAEIASRHLDNVRKHELSRSVIMAVSKGAEFPLDETRVARLADGRVIPAPFVQVPGGTTH